MHTADLNVEEDAQFGRPRIKLKHNIKICVKNML
jgi:hypothetical protein